MNDLNVSKILSTSLGGFTLGHILSAILTLLVCLVVVHLVMKLVTRLLNRVQKLNDRLRKITLTAVKAVLYVLTAIITAGALGVNTTSLTAIMSVLTLGVTLAAEDILGNVAGGLVILSSHPFSIGDVIEVDGAEGTVREITLNHTKLEAYDGQIIMEPNKTLASAKVVNYTTLGRRRIVHNVTASYDAPTQKVLDALVLAGTVDNALLNPAPSAVIVSYDDSAIRYSLRIWVKPGDYWDVYFQVNQRIKDVFDQQGIEMTYPHLNVHLDK